MAEVATEGEPLFTVGVIGGGIGGLALAQFLNKKLQQHRLSSPASPKVWVTVFERDVSSTARQQGYYIGIDEDSCKLLEQVQDELTELKVLLGGQNSVSSVAITNGALEPLLRFGVQPPPATAGNVVPRPEKAGPMGKGVLVNRRRFRESLTQGLDIQWNKRFHHYEELSEEKGGKVRIHFEDGTHADVDFAVGGDGVRSRVRAQRAPTIRCEDVGITFVGALLDLGAKNEPLPAFYTDLMERTLRGTLVRTLGREGHTLLLFNYFETNDSENPDDPETMRRKMLWGLSYPGKREEWDRFVIPLAGFTSSEAEDDEEEEEAAVRKKTTNQALREELKDVLAGKVQQHFDAPELVEMVKQSPWETILGPNQYWSTVPDTLSNDPFSKGRPSRVTLLGDAAHAMTTHRGAGANTAIADGYDLAQILFNLYLDLLPSANEATSAATTASLAWDRFLRQELPKYETQLMKRGRQRVVESLTSTNVIHTTGWKAVARTGFLWTMGRCVNAYSFVSGIFSSG